VHAIIGFGIQAGIVDCLALCQMFKQAIRGASLPKYLSSDHDPLYRFHQWEANLRILGLTEIKTVPWGYRRIQGALSSLGPLIEFKTIANILKEHGIEPLLVIHYQTRKSASLVSDRLRDVVLIPQFEKQALIV
jgi:hypothetical protein